MSTRTIRRIEKETLRNLAFTKHEVLPHAADRAERLQQLQTALRLGNEYKGKVYLLIATEEGPCEVHTTIWNLGQQHLSLKYGIKVPIHAILRVQV
jgi:hypothetical protein